MAQKLNQKHGTGAARGMRVGADDLLQLLVDQLAAAMEDNNIAMAGLIGCHGRIAAELEQLHPCARPRLKEQLDRQLKQMAVTFQQHDSFNQRLSHVMTAMVLIGDAYNNRDPGCWERLAGHVNASYTTAAERSIHSGARPAAPGDDIELF